MRTHLDARRTSVTSRRRDELRVMSPVNDEINELRARLEKLAARNTEAAQSTLISTFSMEIQQALLPASFRMPTIAAYEGRLTLKTIWMPSTTRWTYFRSPHLLAIGVS